MSSLSQYEQDVIWERVVDAVLEALPQETPNHPPAPPLRPPGTSTPLPAPTQNQELPMIDLGFEAARAIGADHHPVSLVDLHAAYLRANPGISIKVNTVRLIPVCGD